MKISFLKSYVFAVSAFALAVPATAQNSDSYANLNKTATYNYETQRGEITLESYVTGIMKVTQQAKPLEILMVLDYSTSMSSSYSSSDTYTKVSATKRYYAMNTKVDGTLVYNYTTDITEGLLKTDSGTQITVKYGDTNYNVYLKRLGSGTNAKHWCYIKVGTKRVFIRMDGSFMEESGTATISSTSTTWPKGTDGYAIIPTMGYERTFFCVLGETSGTAITTRTDALRAAASDFIDEIYSHASLNNVEDKVGIVVFQGKSSGSDNSYPGVYKVNTSYDTDYTTNNNVMYLAEFPTDKKGGGTQDNALEGRSFVSKRFTSIKSQDAQKILKFAINDVTASGETCVSHGLTLATKLITTSARKDTSVAKILILFSDGDPTDTKNTSIQLAKTLKGSDYNWLIYSVYCNSNNPTSATATFLEAISSNYPKAESTTSLGDKNTKDGVEYYKTAKEDLGTVFEKLTGEVTSMAGTQYGTETLLKDFVNNTFFKMPEDIVKSDVKVYEQACTSVTGTSPDVVYVFDDLCIDEGTNANRCWHVGATEAAASTSTRPRLDIKIQRVGDPGFSGTQDQVLISGYDYSADDNWCGLRYDKKTHATKPGGHRLVVKFPYEIKVQSGQTATGALETNGNQSGIYEAKEDENGNKPGDEDYTPTYEEEPETTYPIPVVYFASINITRTGLDKGESAIYDIYQTLNGETTETKVGRLSINGSGSGSDSKIMYGLAGGVGVKYRVVETDWNWAYHNGTLPEQSQPIQQKSSDEPTVPLTSNLNFNFSGAHITPSSSEEATSPFSMFNHDEEYKVNKMSLPSSK